MNRFILSAIISFLCFYSDLHADNNRHTPIRSLGVLHRNADSTLTMNAGIGLYNLTDTLKGVQLSVFFGGVTQYSQGVQLSLLTNTSHSVRGLQLAGLSNITSTPMRGWQLSGLTNIAQGVERGIQVSGIANIATKSMRGWQASIYNYADTLRGSQLGILNMCINHPTGVQVGLVNISKDTLARKIGLVNINPTTDIDFMFWGGNLSKFNAALRFRNQSIYNIFGFGTHYMGLDKKFSGELFYRIGKYFKLSPKWSIGGDIGYSHIETFKRNSLSHPERLYALQGQFTADYQLNSTIGIYGALGYADIRHYHHHRHYKSQPLFQLGITLQSNKPSLSHPTLYKPKESNTDTTYVLPIPQKNLWRSVAEVAGINLLVHSFDRFVMDEDFAKVNLHTIHRNFKKGFVWDNDQFSTNLFAHPYHGNLYFNSARSNGMNFWESTPFALGGSLMWEFFGEIEPPAINDVLATTFGGICIGEVTHRISDLILDNRRKGFSRFIKEVAATLICPMKGFHRITSGDAWHVKYEEEKHGIQYPFSFDMAFGIRYLADDGALFRGESNPYWNLALEYGDAINPQANKPYDYFTANLTFGISGNQPLINGLHILGRLWAAPIEGTRNMEASIGIYQHFNYYDSKPVKDGTQLTPYRISEAASVGPGIIFRFGQPGSLSRLEQGLFSDIILLGGTKSDYFTWIDRDYNMGSGYSLKSRTLLEFSHWGCCTIFADYYRIFTWKGYEHKNLEGLNPLYLNAQGDKGNAQLLVITPRFSFNLSSNWGIEMSGSYYIRKTQYHYYKDVLARTFEVRAGVYCHL